jgi:hypothetical protein
MHERYEKRIKILARKPEGKREHSRSWHRRENIATWILRKWDVRVCTGQL